MKICLVSIIICLVLATMGRYKKIEFKDFSGGQEQEFIENETNFYKISDLQVKNDTKKIKLLGNLVGTDIPSKDDYTIAPDRFAKTGDTALVLISNSTTHLSYLYKSVDGINFTLLNTFSAAVAEGEAKIFAKNQKVVCFFATGYIAVSNDGGDTFTETASAFYPSGSLEIVDDALGYAGKQNVGYALYKTTDFLTYTLIADYIDTFDDIKEIQEFKNFVYFVVDNRLYKIENQTPILVKRFNSTKLIHIQANKEKLVIAYFISKTKIKIIFFDGGDFEDAKIITTTNEYDYLKFLLTTTDETIFVLRQNSATPKEEIQKINNNKSAFKLFSFSHATSNYTDGGTIINEKYIFAVVNQTPPYSYKFYTDSQYSTSGYLETSIFEKGENVPIQIIVRHKPLPANTSVKIYRQFDHAGSYTLILTSDTDNAVKKKYDFPAGTIFDFAQFKIELITTDNTKTPEDVQLEFLYLPCGLENAK